MPACSNTRLLETILRKEWGFTGYVVSDCGAIGDIYQGHKARQDALRKACPKRCRPAPISIAGWSMRIIVPAVQRPAARKRRGRVRPPSADCARFKLGMFDPPAMVKWAQIPYSVNDSPQHAALAVETARKSIVLLKNEGNLLPLSKVAKDHRGDRSQCGRVGGSARQLQRRALASGDSAGGHSRQGCRNRPECSTRAAPIWRPACRSSRPFPRVLWRWKAWTEGRVLQHRQFQRPGLCRQSVCLASHAEGGGHPGRSKAAVHAASTPRSSSTGRTARRAPIWTTIISACAGPDSWRPQSPASTSSAPPA